jgi:para-nitrobenzyl esterase
MQELRKSLLAMSSLAVIASVSPVIAQDASTVETVSGPVQGAASEHNDAITVFKGIRYGADTSGANRFRPPRPVEAWAEVQQATSYGNACYGLGYPPFLMQEEGADLDTSPMSEDCLFLNVWTPGLGEGERAVMVWFHGGGFTSGSGGSVRYDGTNLAAGKDVVLVTVNHRLGALGFMDVSATGGDEFADSGNAGMLDIVQSLEWVRDNITKFGGDPENVTVFGESGGGSKVTTLMSMPAAEGLFDRVIAQSGINVAAIPAETAQETAAAAMEALGAGSVDALQQVDPQMVTTVQGNWGPVATPSLPRNPFAPDADPRSTDIPMMFGSNLTEATFFNATPTEPVDDAGLKAAFAEGNFTRGIPEANVDVLMDAYRGIFSDAEDHVLFQILASDAWMTNLVQNVANLRTEAEAPSWVYHFAMPQGARDGALNVPHTAEIAYAFDNLDLSATLVGEPDTEDRALAAQMSTAWTNFAKTGNPNGESVPEWPQWTSETKSVMVFDEDPMAEVDPFSARLAALAAARE